MAFAAPGLRDRSRCPDPESVFGYFAADRWTMENGGMGAVGRILRSLSVGMKRIAHVIRCAALQPGAPRRRNAADASNPRGLRQRATGIFARTLARSDLAGDVRSRPVGVVEMASKPRESRSYAAFIQSLDTPEAVPVTAPAATTFAVYQLPVRSQRGKNPVDLVRSAADPVAAGYGLYGRSAHLVVADRYGVNGFRLEPSIGEFCLTATNLKVPEAGTYRAVTGESSMKRIWRTAVQMGVPENVTDGRRERPSVRSGGSLVIHLHNVCRRGGRVRFFSVENDRAERLDSLVKTKATSLVVEAAGGTVVQDSIARSGADASSAHAISVLQLGSPSAVRGLEATGREDRGDEPLE